MEEINNYEWIDTLPTGWKELARKMIEECEAIDPTYYICDLKEKWGTLDVIANCNMDCWREIDEIENRYESLSARTCCVCGQPAVKYSTGWILPWCDKCGKDEEKYYKRFNGTNLMGGYSALTRSVKVQFLRSQPYGSVAQ